MKLNCIFNLYFYMFPVKNDVCRIYWSFTKGRRKSFALQSIDSNFLRKLCEIDIRYLGK